MFHGKSTPTPDRQDLRDQLLAYLAKGPDFWGTRKNGRRDRGEPTQARLIFDDKLNLVTGWIDYTSLGNKKAVEGRIIDNMVNPPYIQLAETKILESGSNAGLGYVYALQLAPDAHPSPALGNSAPPTHSPATADTLLPAC